MNADGSEQTRLTSNESSDWHPAWSPVVVSHDPPPTATPTPIPTPTPSVSYDGSWFGLTSIGTNIYFTVVNNLITEVRMGWNAIGCGTPAELAWDPAFGIPSVADGKLAFSQTRGELIIQSWAVSGTLNGSTAAGTSSLAMTLPPGPGSCTWAEQLTWSASR